MTDRALRVIVSGVVELGSIGFFIAMLLFFADAARSV
jgi:hypothetical protein